MTRSKPLVLTAGTLGAGLVLAACGSGGPASSDGHSSGTQHGEEHEAQVRSPCSLYAPETCRANCVARHV